MLWIPVDAGGARNQQILAVLLLDRGDGLIQQFGVAQCLVDSAVEDMK